MRSKVHIKIHFESCIITEHVVTAHLYTTGAGARTVHSNIYLNDALYHDNVAGLFSAGGMGLWHGVEYYEEEKLKTEPWKASWNEVNNNSLVSYS